MPKKIHQIWLSDTEPTPIRKKLYQTIKDKNPGFEVILWQNEDLTPKNFPISFSFMQRSFVVNEQSSRSYIAPITALMRYEILYNHGGLYMDFKTEGLKSLEPFLKYTFISSDI